MSNSGGIYENDFCLKCLRCPISDRHDCCWNLQSAKHLGSGTVFYWNNYNNIKKIDGKSPSKSVTPDGDNYHVTVGSKSYTVSAKNPNGTLTNSIQYQTQSQKNVGSLSGTTHSGAFTVGKSGQNAKRVIIC
jgi:hypothetical protein